MDIATLRRTSLFLMNKHQSGNTFSPDEYNDLLETINASILTRLTSPESVDPSLPFNMRDMEDYLSVTLGGPQGAPAPVPVNNVITMPIYTRIDSVHYAAVQGVWNPTDIVKNEEVAGRVQNRVTAGVPFVVINQGKIEIHPLTITASAYSWRVTYLRVPAKPVFDYYITAAGEEVPLAVGEIPPQSGVTYSGLSSSPTNDSVTVEIDLPVQVHHFFLRMLMSYCGINLQSAEVVQYAEQMMKTQ